MRYGILVAIACSWVLAGATCFPLIDLDQGGQYTPPTTLDVTVLSPDADRVVPLGAVVPIEWTSVNLTGSDALATIIARERSNFADTVLAGGVRVPESGGVQSVDWDTSGFPGGEYSIVARIEAGGLVKEDSAPGRLTLNTAPSFEFTEPVEDATLGKGSLTQKVGDGGPNGDGPAASADDPNDPNDPNAPDATLTIAWTAFDPDGDGSVQIGIDPDDDHESGNETIIVDQSLPSELTADSLDWDGTDVGGEAIDAGTYNLYALVSDGINEDQLVEGLAQVTVPEPEEEPDPTVLAITEPAEDTEFLASDDPLAIELTLDEEDDVLIDVKADADDNHLNGNEVTLRSQWLIEKGTTEGSWDWDGTVDDGGDIADGIYRLFIAVNRGSGTPAIVAAEGLVFRRSSENQPLIALLAPATDQTVDAGAFVSIQWRDDDPDEEAEVRLTLDDDETPNEQVEADGNPEMEILAGRVASGDGVQDTYQYQVPSDLEPGRYYIFAYIERDGTVDNISVAAGQIVIEDPDAQP